MSRLNISGLLVLTFSIAVFAKYPPARDRGVLTEMQSISCGTMQKSGSTVAGVLITGATHTKSRELLCQEYVLKSDRVTYRIRPKEEKHPVLLRVGDEAEFRLKKDEMLLRIPEGDNKEREYVVVSMTASPEFTSELNKTQHPPKPHGKKLNVNEPEPQPVAAQNERPADPPIQARAQPPAPAPAPVPQTALIIDSTPPGAEIYVDSVSAGRTPATLTVAPGQHTIQIAAFGYKDWVNTVTVQQGTQQKVAADLAK